MSRGAEFLYKDPAVYAELGDICPTRKRIAGYLGRMGEPLYRNTACNYYPSGELYFEAMLKDMEQAERFIFLEYFILKEGKLWNQMREILIRKASQGVEVRILIDDIGSVAVFSKRMFRELKANKIQITRFNDIHGIFSRNYFNFRNHQKITVIDGNIGYTGGANIADEYINAIVKYGHWKDTGIRLEGDAVWSLTVTFLQMWDSEAKAESDYEAYRSTALREKCRGFYQPFTDGPANDADIAKNVYKSFIFNAKSYVYITTPYLIVDSAVIDALRIAAKGGTDVRIIVPKLWDKWFVHMVTLSNYKTLLEAGVRIFEYTPGFIHSKTIISDDDHAVIGTINMDYRSFYLHYENGVWLCGAPVIQDIKQDMLQTLGQCEEILLEDWIKRPLHEKCLQNALRLFAVVF
jgi:cardiolipin synthase